MIHRIRAILMLLSIAVVFALTAMVAFGVFGCRTIEYVSPNGERASYGTMFLKTSAKTIRIETSPTTRTVIVEEATGEPTTELLNKIVDKVP